MSRNHLLIRLLFDCVVLISVLFGWWPVALIVGFVGAWFFPAYLEFLAAGFLYDALFGLNSSQFMFGLAGTLTTAVLLAILRPLKLLVR